MGHVVDTSLMMKKQMATVCSKVSRNIALFKYPSLESCQKLAAGLFMAILDYGNVLYSWLTNKELRKFQILQNHAAKTVLGRNRNDSSTLARYELHCLPVEERMRIKILTLVYKCSNDQAPLCLQELVKYQDSERATR